MLKPGLYETVIDQVLKEELGRLELSIKEEKLDAGNVADRISNYISGVIREAINNQSDSRKIEFANNLGQHILNTLAKESASVAGQLIEPLSVLKAIHENQIGGQAKVLESPEIPLLDTVLLTNSPREPSASVQIASEIASADEVMLIMAFIRKSGLRRFRSALEKHCLSGKRLRVLTTTYTGSTELGALEQLQEMGAEVRVSYDLSSTRLHAKGWIFDRASGFSTGYIGSSNLTHSAQVTGLEWNLRISGSRNPDATKKMQSMFEAYWESGDFEEFNVEDFAARTQRSPNLESSALSPIEIRLEPFQERLLELIQVARENSKTRNLLVAATGTGKTVMAAVDYARLSKKMGQLRLLFVAHTREILQQSRATFRHALRDGSFGELWVGGNRPSENHHVFASIQSLNSSGYESFPPEHFDVVIVDEFHHSAAKTYKRLLEHIKPKQLLGLTATPERADGVSILNWFDNEIAAELRLWDAIDQRRLCPFEYFGVADQLDYTQIPWKRGRGYEVVELENLYTSNDAWVRFVIKTIQQHVDDLSKIGAIGFCVSVKHAEYMKAAFRSAGLAAEFVSGDTPVDQRVAVLKALENRDVNFLFAVDLLNEGVDLPSIDTLLMLRPTDSSVLFTQQIGRGLRRHPDKTTCLILDFIGQHHKDYRLERRLGSLLRGSRKEIEKQIRGDFPYLPAGCHIELDRVAKEVVLSSLKSGVPSLWRQKVEELRKLAEQNSEIGLSEFLAESGMELIDVYPRGGQSGWSQLSEDAGLPTFSKGPYESQLRKSIGRLLHITDVERLRAFSNFLKKESVATPKQTRLLKMLLAEMFQSVSKLDSEDLMACQIVLQEHPQVVEEIKQLLDCLKKHTDHLHLPIECHPNLPLRVHGRYSRTEILAAFNIGDELSVRSKPWREGAVWSEEENADVFVVTLNKSKGNFSPTTMYQDYALSRDLFHWESQSQVREDSPRGRRYQNHEEQGSAIMLFVRNHSDERAFWFLGPATYVKHKSEKPMEVTWKLEYPLPGDLYEEFAAAVA